MEENQQYRESQEPKRTAPYAVASLVLGISSLVFSGVGITLVLGIIGLVFSNKGLAELERNPRMYTGDGMLRAGKVTSIVGIVFGGLALLAIVAVLIVGLGVAAAALGGTL